jgi:hypothetical protein
MGRPINKRFFGALGTDLDPNIPITFHDGSNVVEGYILNQKGTNKFTVRNPATSPVTDVVVRLTADGSTPNAEGEAMIEGYVTDRDTAAIRIVKLFNRTAIDADSNRYTWELEDDSTSSVIILTAI